MLPLTSVLMLHPPSPPVPPALFAHSKLPIESYFAIKKSSVLPVLFVFTNVVLPKIIVGLRNLPVTNIFPIESVVIPCPPSKLFPVAFFAHCQVGGCALTLNRSEVHTS